MRNQKSLDQVANLSLVASQGRPGVVENSGTRGGSSRTSHKGGWLRILEEIVHAAAAAADGMHKYLICKTLRCSAETNHVDLEPMKHATGSASIETLPVSIKSDWKC